MIDAFLINAILAGLGVVVAATFLGCFVVWRRMAYFGDATAGTPDSCTICSCPYPDETRK